MHAGQTIAAGPGVRPGPLGTAPNPGGGRVFTYHGWPLYTYLDDVAPGHAAGQSADDDGGYWYVIRPSGKIVGNWPRRARLATPALTRAASLSWITQALRRQPGCLQELAPVQDAPAFRGSRRTHLDPRR